MFRLSYNTWRRGLFQLCVLHRAHHPVLTVALSNEEDYRWAVLRNKIPPWLFQVINLTFIGTSNSPTRYMPSFVDAHYSRDPKHPPPLDRHSHLDRRDPLEPPIPFRWHPGTHRARASRVRVHRGQPAVRVPRVETRDVRSARALARRTSRVDQGRRRAWILHARPVVLEPAPELLRRAVVLGVSPSPPSRYACLPFADIRHPTGCAQSHPSPLLSQRATAGFRGQKHTRRRTAFPRAALALARPLPAFRLFDALHRVHFGEQVPAGLRRVLQTRCDVRSDVDACVGRASQLDGRETGS